MLMHVLCKEKALTLPNLVISGGKKRKDQILNFGYY